MILYKKVAAAGKYQDDNAISDLINYITRPDKTPSGIIGGYSVDGNNIASSMIALSQKYGKYSRVRLHHFIVSFDKADIPTPEILPRIADAICATIADRFQIVYALHEDTPHPHFHFVFNAVSYVDGTKYRAGKLEYNALIRSIEVVLSTNDLYPLIPVNYRPDPVSPHE